MTRPALLMLLVGLAVSGCCPRSGEKPPAKAATTSPATGVTSRAEQSTLQTVVDGVTGRAAVQRRKEAKAVVDEAARQKNKDLEDAMK